MLTTARTGPSTCLVTSPLLLSFWGMAYCPPFCTIWANWLVMVRAVSMKQSTQLERQFSVREFRRLPGFSTLYHNIAPWSDAPEQRTAPSAVRLPPGAAILLSPPYPAPPLSVYIQQFILSSFTTYSLSDSILLLQNIILSVFAFEEDVLRHRRKPF
jgi:hypothetical protein